MRQDIECSLCGFVIHAEDFPFEQRKNRHRDYHTEKGINNIVGKVSWVTLWN